MAFYESVGIGPWHDYPDLTAFTDLDVPSVDGFHKLIYKWAMIGDLQLQLVEAGPDGTPQRGFLEAHGPCVYHVGFVVEDADSGDREAKALGLETSARGRRPDGSGFTYFHTRDLAGVTLEIRQSPPGENLAASTRSAPDGTPFREVHHICVAVSDIERAAAFYENLGIGPWQPLPRMNDLVRLDGPTPEAFHDLAYKWTTIGDLQLQLVQPGAGRTPQGLPRGPRRGRLPHRLLRRLGRRGRSDRRRAWTRRHPARATKRRERLLLLRHLSIRGRHASGPPRPGVVILATGAAGQGGGQADRAVTNSLETILARLPRSLSEFLADHHGAVE
jgi:methylmalonyl-CoA/ethylmalonyl-CoA epimerase